VKLFTSDFCTNIGNILFFPLDQKFNPKWA